MAEYVAPPPEDEFVVYDGGDLPEVDADTVLLEHRYERTVPKVTGAPYDLLGVIRARKAADAAKGTFDAGGHVEVVAPGWWCEPDDLPRAPKPIAKTMIASGWEVRCCASIAYVTPTLFAHASDKHAQGELRFPDRDETSWSIQGVLRRGPTVTAALWATWVTREQVGAKPKTAFRDAVTQDLVLGREFYDAAGEFKEWLGIFTA